MISGLFSLLGAAVLVVIDQLIKHWATAALLPVGNMDVLPGIVELRYCLNDGMAFSMLAGKQTLLIGMTCCAARVVFGSCAEIGVQQTVRNLEDFFLWLRDVWALARVKLNLCMVTV